MNNSLAITLVATLISFAASRLAIELVVWNENRLHRQQDHTRTGDSGR